MNRTRPAPNPLRGDAPLALEIRGLGKAYELQHRASTMDLREALMRRLRHPFRRRTREQFWALRGVDLELRRGEVLGILGCNGAGKSTLLKILSRITPPTEGEVRLYGTVGSLLEVGTGFHRELTGRENVYLSGSMLGMSRRAIDARFDAIVAFAGIGRFLDTPVKRYSSGMYVRLAFAVAAHLETDIVIVDEVLAVGDAEFQRKCLQKMDEVANQQRTVLLVSHNTAAVLSLCTRAIVLERGRIACSGTPEECAEFYARRGVREPRQVAVPLARPDGAHAWLTEARICSGGQPTARLAMGEPLELEVDFTATEPVQPAIGVVVTDALGLRVLHVSTRYAHEESFLSPVTRGTIRCDFGMVPFTPGKYYVSLYFGGRVDDVHRAESCIAFEVVPQDLWGIGRPYEAKHSLLWWPAELSLEPDREEPRCELTGT